MCRVIILGTSNAVATPDHENTHMIVVGETRTVLVDCVSSPLLRLEKAGVDFQSVTDLILTHFHPDHVSGVPLFLMDMWLLGRRLPLTVHGLDHTLDRVEKLMELYGWLAWPNFYPVSFERVPLSEMAEVLDGDDLRVLSSPVRHLVPTIGLRVECKHSSRRMVYSCDTEPCPEVVRLAAGADILIHEAAGQGRGHSSAGQAAEVASEAEVGELLLIHYPTGKHASRDLVDEAHQRYQGKVALARDFMELNLD